MQVSTDRPSKIGHRRGQAARERAIALKVASAVGVLALVVLVASVAVGWTGSLSSASAMAKTSAAASSSSTSAGPVAAPIAGQTGTAVSANTKHAVAKDRSASSKRSSAPKKRVAKPTKSTAAKAAVARKPGDNKTHVRRPAARAPSKPGTKAASVPARRGAARGTVTIVTFGHSFGPAPSGARFTADVRNIGAGDFPPTVTGLMPSVRARVMRTAAAQAWLSRMENVWEPKLENGDLIAIGCSRGHHRSVTLAVLFAEHLRAHGWKVKLVHRDIAKTW